MGTINHSVLCIKNILKFWHLSKTFHSVRLLKKSILHMKNQIKASIRKAIILHHTEGMSYRGTVHQLCGFDVTKNQVE